MASNNLSDAALTEVAYLLSPLRYLNTPDKVIVFMRKLGFDVPAGNLVDSLGDVSIVVVELIAATQKLIEADTDSKRLTALAALLPTVKQAFVEANKLGESLRATPGLAADFVNKAPLDSLPERLLNYLIFQSLNKRHAKIFGTLFLLGILDEQDLAEDIGIYQPACSLKLVHWDRIPRYLSESGVVIDEVYSWNSDFHTDLLFKRLELFLRALTLPGGIYKQSPTVKNALGNTQTDLSELRIPIFSGGTYRGTFSQVGLNLTPVEAKAGKKKGIAFVLYLAGTTSLTMEINDDWEAELQTSVALDAGLGVSIRPPLEVEAFQNIFINPVAASTLDAGIFMRQKLGADNQIPEIFLFGDKANTHLSVKDISLKVFGRTNTRAKDVGGEIEIKTVNFLLSATEGDAFLKQILPPEGIAASFGFGFGFSLANGFYFKGSSGIEVLLPVHIQLGPVDVEGVLISVQPENGIIPVEISSTIKAELGPLKAVVENIGIKTDFSFPPSRDGNLGPVQVDLGFRPPNRVGLSIDAGLVKGGGYLSVDFEKGEYCGALQLEVEGLLSMSALGLITTKNPDGSPGFSMVIIVTAEFMPPFQLSYGFTLMGVGGLLGVNRTVLLDPLRDGVRTGAINGIMFPTDIVANAPRILSDLRTIFPAMEGYFLVGPMAEIGWGTPTLISLSLGVIIQLPDPKIAILGVLKMVLPTEEAAVLKLQVNFLGTIDPANNLLTFDASLFDSNLLRTLTLTGDMAVRLKWGDKPDFILSAGGFNPGYEPTMPMPALQRIGITILNLENARIRVQTYFALTSNTVQLGAKADCFFGIDDFSVNGDLGFDALMQFSPFLFNATCSGDFTLDTPLGDASIHIRALIKGTTPWYAKVNGSIRVFGVEFEAEYEKEWGERRADILPEIAVIPLFAAKMQKAEVWHVEPPGRTRQMIAFTNAAELEPGVTPPLRVQPFGCLVISQKLLPLNVQLEKLGNQKISDARSVAIESVAVGTNAAALSAVKADFAAAQFKNLSDAEKISRPSFEKFNSGVKASFNSNNADFILGNAVRRSLEFEQIYVDRVPTPQRAAFAIGNARFKDLLKGSAIKKSKLSAQYRGKLGKRKPGAPSTESKISFTIGNALDNKPINGGLAFPTMTEAEDAMRSILTRNSTLKGNITLIEES